MDGRLGLILDSLLRHPIQISHLDIDLVCVVGLLCMVKGEGRRAKGKGGGDGGNTQSNRLGIDRG